MRWGAESQGVGVFRPSRDKVEGTRCPDNEAPSPLIDTWQWQCMTGDVQDTDDDMIWPPLNGLTVWKLGITASTRLIFKGRAGIVYDHFYRSFSHFFFFFLRLALGSERAKPGSTATSRTALITQQNTFHYSHEHVHWGKQSIWASLPDRKLMCRLHSSW